jgi:outer membrane protein OmpA-like peptidoglycan-associated protein
LSGHTDNVGKPESNLTLSKNRTLAVKNYLVKKGVEIERIRTEWYGQTKPVADNASPEGRQRNRRVEMSIVFE